MATKYVDHGCWNFVGTGSICWHHTTRCHLRTAWYSDRVCPAQVLQPVQSSQRLIGPWRQWDVYRSIRTVSSTTITGKYSQPPSVPYTWGVPR